MKKLLIATLAVACIFGAVGASAQTIAVSAKVGGMYQQTFDTPVGPFNTAVWMDTTGLDANAAEFVVTDLLALIPGSFKLSTVKINNTTLDLGDNSVGEYLLSFGGCVSGGAQVELIDVQYGDFGGAAGADIVMFLRGFEPGDSRPSSFGGEPGFVDCGSIKHNMTVGGTDGGTTGSGVVFPDGTCVLNPTPEAVPNEGDSFGSLKGRF
ncbi:hypothetical protein DRQ53_11555 [bacterium]|nr:MAG: hypothetical protein DRQ32_02115 [bacterium]RKZ14446.1 MAG: hypothetical protein DRQ53_11555 [bacterium]